MKETICYAVLYIIEALIAWRYFDYLFNTKRSKSTVVITFALGYALLFLVYMKDSFWPNLAFCLIVNAVLLMINYDCKIFTVILHVAYLCLIMIITEFLTMLALTAVFDDFSAYRYNFVALISVSSLSKLLYFVTMEISARYLWSHNQASSNSNLVLLFCLLPITSGIVIVAYMCIARTTALSLFTEVMMATSTLFLLFSNILSFILLDNLQKVNQENLSMQLMLQKEQADTDYYAMLQTQYDQQRILIYDIKNHAQIIRSLIREHQGDELENYLDHFESLPELRQKMRLCDNHVCNLLLLQFLGQCREAGVSLHHDIRGQSISFLDPTDITALFGNLLSNALEAAKQSEKKTIEISTRCQKDQGVTLVVVKNSCDQPPARGSDGQYLTRKPDKANHGIGLKSIRRIAKKYKGDLELYYDPEQKLFHTIILLRHP